MNVPLIRWIAVVLSVSLITEQAPAFVSSAGASTLAPAAIHRLSQEALSVRPVAALYRSRSPFRSPERFRDEVVKHPLFNPMGRGVDRVRFITRVPEQTPFTVSFDIDTTKIASLIHTLPETDFALLVAPLETMEDSTRERLDLLLEFPPLPEMTLKPEYLILGHLDEPLFVARRSLVAPTKHEAKFIERTVQEERARHRAVVLRREGFVDRFDVWPIDREQYDLQREAMEALSEYLDDTYVFNIHTPDIPIQTDIERGNGRTRFTLTTPRAPKPHAEKPQTRKDSRPRPYGRETIHVQGVLVALGLSLGSWPMIVVGLAVLLWALWYAAKEHGPDRLKHIARQWEFLSDITFVMVGLSVMNIFLELASRWAGQGPGNNLITLFYRGVRMFVEHPAGDIVFKAAFVFWVAKGIQEKLTKIRAFIPYRNIPLQPKADAFDNRLYALAFVATVRLANVVMLTNIFSQFIYEGMMHTDILLMFTVLIALVQYFVMQVSFRPYVELIQHPDKLLHLYEGDIDLLTNNDPQNFKVKAIGYRLNITKGWPYHEAVLWLEEPYILRWVGLIFPLPEYIVPVPGNWKSARARVTDWVKGFLRAPAEKATAPTHYQMAPVMRAAA